MPAEGCLTLGNFLAPKGMPRGWDEISGSNLSEGKILGFSDICKPRWTKKKLFGTVLMRSRRYLVEFIEIHTNRAKHHSYNNKKATWFTQSSLCYFNFFSFPQYHASINGTKERNKATITAQNRGKLLFYEVFFIVAKESFSFYKYKTQSVAFFASPKQ